MTRGTGSASRIALLLALNLVAISLLVAVQPPARWTPPSDDPHTMLVAIADRHRHGSLDDYESIARLTQIAVNRPIVTTCGPASVWTVELLRRVGIEARVVTTLTLAEWNSLDNGHTLVEVRSGAGWAVYDIDRDVRYTTPGGAPLTLAGLVQRVPTDDYRLEALGELVGEGFIREANNRLLQAPGIEEDGFYWFPAVGAEAVRIESYAPDYRAIPPDEWAERFYEGATRHMVNG